MSEHKAATIGLALGGGGVRGLAHIPLLIALDDAGLSPRYVAGTSMGAIIGALYCTGLSGAQIMQHVRAHLLLKDDDLKAIYHKRKQLVKWVQAITPAWGESGMIRAEGLFTHFFDQLLGADFADLARPFTAIACDYWTGEEVALHSGELLPAVQASMAVPGVFTAIEAGEQLLVDGGLVNNLPYERVAEHCDICIAIDLTPLPVNDDTSPKALDVAAGAIDIMQRAALASRFKQQQPDVCIRPELSGIDIFDFHRIEDVLAAGEAAADNLRAALQRLGCAP